MILMSFGTRPEYIKIKPLINELSGKIPYKLLFTGQHVDLLSGIEDDVLELRIQSGENRLDSIVTSIMNQEYVFENIDSVLVQGDTTSALAVAMAAFHRKIKIVHLEAGLRTYDKEQPYPEEFNRQSISRMADVHLCPTNASAQNLKNEKVNGSIHIVGNTVLDNLKNVITEHSNKVVVTMHRRENHKDLHKWFETINNLAKENKDLEFIIPLHPNPSVQKHSYLLKDLKIIEPMVYNKFIDLLAKSRFAITDSGGLQEETSFLGKKCIVCREKTERTEGLGTFSYLCETPDKLKSTFEKIKNDYIPHGICPYGDGYAANKIYEILKDEV